MAILDQFGRRFAHGASRQRSRGPYWNRPNKGVDDLIPSTDRKALAALSREIVYNNGPAKESIRQKASFSVGSAWKPIYTGSDTDVGEEAASWLENVWFPLCDVRGGGHDWHEFLELVSKGMDREGEAFVLLTKTPDGFPQVQHVPAHQVWSDRNEKKVKKGSYAGLKLEDGIIYNRRGRPVAYRVHEDDTGNNYQDVSARDIIHVYDSDFPEQKRGYPAFAHALNDLKNSMSSQELETIRQNVLSSIYLIESSELEPDPNDPAWESSIDTGNQEGVLYEQIAPGIRHIKGSEKIDAIKHENPGDIWESFQDRLIRGAVIGAGWCLALVWKSPGQGTAERAEVVRARKAVEARQKKLRYVARRVVTYAIAVADSLERLNVRAPGNMLKWEFNTPERLTVDDGREAKAMLEAAIKGAISEQEYQTFRGKGYEQHCREMALAKVTRHRVAREVTESNDEGVTINPEDLGVVMEDRPLSKSTEQEA